MTLRSIATRLLASALALGIPACAAAPYEKKIPGGPIDQGPGSVAAARKYLEGRWQLESFEVRPPQQAPLKLEGQGTLTYDEFSNLTMEIRTDVATSDKLRAAGIEIQDGIISSKGRTAVDMQNRTLTYMLEGQPKAGGGPLAANRPRHWQVEGNVLTVTTQDDAGAILSVGRWKKIS